MNLLEKIKSKTDNTIKYIFTTHDNLVIEMAYINKNDGKDINCVPSQTSCKMKCKFCHITDVKLINEMINEYKGKNLCYTLDVGVNDKGTFILESHDFFSCGLYGFSDYRILPKMFIATWNKLIN